jgi:hypothetical protein
MNLVEVRLDGSENYRTLCVSTDTFNDAQLVSLLKNEHYFGKSDVVGRDKHLAWQEDAVYFYASGGFSGVFVRQREVKVYHLSCFSNNEVTSL